MTHRDDPGSRENVTLPKEEWAKFKLSHIAFKASTEGMIVTDASQTILLVNPAFTQITGYSEEEAIGKTPKILQSGRQGPEFYKAMWRELDETDHWQGEIWNRRKNGEIYPEWLSVTQVRDGQGKASYCIGLFSDITKRKQAEEKIYHRANHDALTGLANRMLFSERLEQTIKQSRRTEQRTAVIFVDLDHFKQVNDTLGHNVGDLVLEETAKRLQRCVRETDTVARASGDEFLILLTDVTGRRDATQVSEKILNMLSQPFLFHEQDIFIGASCGITIAPDDGIDAARLIKNADMAMYKAKSSGRNAFHFFSRKMNTSAKERTMLEWDLRKAITEKKLVVHFQPIVDLKTQGTIALEALVRWNHPEQGLLLPEAFIPLAEESELISKIDQWVIRTGCEQVKAWRDRYGLAISLSVNMSRRQFRDTALWDFMARSLDESGLPPEAFMIEITESLMLDSKNEFSKKLQRFRKMGIKTAIDDFGTGYSSLSRLLQDPIDLMKIDPSFIHGIEINSKKKALLENIIRMGRSLNMSVLAEGIETEKTFLLLKEMGCDLGQGYFFCPPCSVEDYEVQLQAKKK